MKATDLLHPKEQAKRRAFRRKLAMTPGSEWVFFRDGDEADPFGNFRDPWSSLEIKIVKAWRDKRGRMQFLAQCIQPHLIDPEARKVPSVRRVRYSELW